MTVSRRFWFLFGAAVLLAVVVAMLWGGTAVHEDMPFSSLGSENGEPHAQNPNSGNAVRVNAGREAMSPAFIRVQDTFGDALSMARINGLRSADGRYRVSELAPPLHVVCDGYHDIVLVTLPLADRESSQSDDLLVILEQKPGVFVGCSAPEEVTLFAGEVAPPTQPGQFHSQSPRVVLEGRHLHPGEIAFVEAAAGSQVRLAATGSRGLGEAIAYIAPIATPDAQRTVTIDLVERSSVWGHVERAATPQLPIEDLRIIAMPATMPPTSTGLSTIGAVEDMDLLDAFAACRLDADSNYRIRGLRTGSYWLYVVWHACRVSRPIQIQVADGTELVAPTIATALGCRLEIRLTAPEELTRSLDVVIRSEDARAQLGLGMRHQAEGGAWRLVGLASAHYKWAYEPRRAESATHTQDNESVRGPVLSLVQRWLNTYAATDADLTTEELLEVRIDWRQLCDAYQAAWRSGGAEFFDSWRRQASDARKSSIKFFLEAGLDMEAARIAVIERYWHQIAVVAENPSAHDPQRYAGIQRAIHDRDIDLLVRSAL